MHLCNVCANYWSTVMDSRISEQQGKNEAGILFLKFKNESKIGDISFHIWKFSSFFLMGACSCIMREAHSRRAAASGGPIPIGAFVAFGQTTQRFFAYSLLFISLSFIFLLYPLLLHRVSNHRKLRYQFLNSFQPKKRIKKPISSKIPTFRKIHHLHPVIWLYAKNWSASRKPI